MKEREYQMPKAIQNKLHDIYTLEENPIAAEQAVIDAASELGYEVEDERESRNREEGGFMWNVKLVKREPGKYGDVLHVGWAHFNHPADQYAKRRDEWYMYFL